MALDIYFANLKRNTGARHIVIIDDTFRTHTQKKDDTQMSLRDQPLSCPTRRLSQTGLMASSINALSGKFDASESDKPLRCPTRRMSSFSQTWLVPRYNSMKWLVGWERIQKNRYNIENG